VSSIVDEGVSLPLPVDRTCFIFDQNFGKKRHNQPKVQLKLFDQVQHFEILILK